MAISRVRGGDFTGKRAISRTRRLARGDPAPDADSGDELRVAACAAIEAGHDPRDIAEWPTDALRHFLAYQIGRDQKDGI